MCTHICKPHQLIPGHLAEGPSLHLGISCTQSDHRAQEALLKLGAAGWLSQTDGWLMALESGFTQVRVLLISKVMSHVQVH